MSKPDNEQRKRLCRDLWIIWMIQFFAFVMMWGLTYVLGEGICVGRHDWGTSMIPNRPQWDAVHLFLLRVMALNAIVLYIACWWGSVKLLSRLVPMAVRFFAMALFLACVVLLLCFCDATSMFEIACSMIVIVPIYSLSLLFCVCCWMSEQLRQTDGEKKNSENAG